jgi:tetratricopeptide (TPR) repeat protein
MNRFAAIALSAAFLFASPLLSAQQLAANNSSRSPLPGQSGAPEAPAMTPRETAEMHADILMARKMYADAIHQYESLLATAPKDAPLLNKIGVAYQEEGNAALAGRYYKKSMHADKTFASAINNLGTVEYSRKHYGRAIRYYKEAVALHPDDELATVYSNMGYAYFSDKQYPSALDAFDKAIALDPQIFAHHGGYGSTIQQRSTTEPGLFYFLVAKTYARKGDVEHCAHYLKMARDDGYKDILAAEKDPEFARVIKDPRVREVLQVVPPYAVGESKQPPPPQQH